MNDKNYAIFMIILLPWIIFFCYKVLNEKDPKTREAFIQLVIGLVLFWTAITLFDVLDLLIWKGHYQISKTITNIFLALALSYLFSKRKHRDDS